MKFIAIVVFAGIWATSSAQSYQQSYQLGAPAPVYNPPPPPPQQPYQAPIYTAKTGYGPVTLGMPVPYTYPSAAPPVPCPTNLLLSCAPSVAPVPCQSVNFEKPGPPPPPPPPPQIYTKPAPLPPNYR